MNAPASALALDASRPVSQAPNTASATVSTSSSKVTKPHAQLIKAAEEVRGKTKDAEGKGSSAVVNRPRRCLGDSCKNVLAPGWRWHRCQTCRGAGLKRTTVNVPCESCTAAVAVSASVVKSGERTICARCRQRALAAKAGIMLPEPPPMSVMGPPAGKPVGQYMHSLVHIAPRPSTHSSILEQAMPFIHPDNLRTLEARRRLPPDPHFIPPRPPPAYTPPVHSPSEELPHYGPRGEILVALPESVRESPKTRGRPPLVHTVAQPFTMPQSGRTAAESIVIPGSSDIPANAQNAPERLDLVTISLEEALPVIKNTERSKSSSGWFSPANDGHLAALPQDGAAPKKKRKRVLAPLPADLPQSRSCASSSCDRPLPPQAQGEFCSDCGFLLWRKQFRARVAGLSATVSAEPRKVDKGKEKAVKLEPSGVFNTEVAPTVVPEPRVPEASIQNLSSSTPRPVARLADSETTVSKPRPLMLKLPATSTVGRGLPEVKPRAATAITAVDDDSTDDEEPLSAMVARKRSMTTPPQPTVTALPRPEATYTALPLSEAGTTAPSLPHSAITASTLPEVSSSPSPPLEQAYPARADESTPVPPLSPHPTLPATPDPPADALLHLQSPEEQKPIVPRPRIRLILHPPRPPPPDSSESDEDSSAEESLSPSPSRSSSPSSSRSSPTECLTLEALTRRASLVWDSDESELTPLEDLTDMGESEVDQSDSEDEVPPTPKDTDLVPQALWPAPKPPPKHRGICGVTRCMNLLSEGTRMRFCHMCAARKRLIQRHSRHAGTVPLDKVEDEEMAITVPANGDLTGYRKCNKKHCKRYIPPEADYNFKTCPSCRVAARNRARLRRAVPLELLLLDDADDDDDDDEEDIPLATTVALRKLAPRAHKAAKPSSAVHTPHAPPNTASEKQLPDVPAYQHFAALLTAFSARFAEFAVAQAHYLRFKVEAQAARGDSDASTWRRNPIVFRFDGEYSIVADPSGGLVDAIVQCVVRNVQAAVGLNFNPVAVNAGPESSVVAVLRCMYGAQVAVQRRPAPASPKPASKDEAPAADKDVPDVLLVKMVGELQVCVAWDRRHALFPGQRVIVRFRLVG